MPLAPIPLEAMEKAGIGLDRPEDVVISREGRVFASDHQCAVAELLPDGGLKRIGARGGAPNGINMDAKGRVIIANFGIYDLEPGPLQRLDVETGELETLAGEVAGKNLTSCNYPIVARDGTIWTTHSTFAENWPQALDGRNDGFVFCYTPKGEVKLAAEGLCFANGCCLDEDEAFLYVNQTSKGNVVRFPILEDGCSLGAREEYGPVLGIIPDRPANPQQLPSPEEMANWAYTDGNGFDVEGNLWVTLPAANKLVAITPEREVITIAHDLTGEILNHPTNVSWGGADMRDLYIGSIRANYVVKTRSPVAGMKLIHQR